MKKSEIMVGKTYSNRGKGSTRRKVRAINMEICPPWVSENKPPEEPGVEYEQEFPHYIGTLYLSSFASWAGAEVKK